MPLLSGSISPNYSSGSCTPGTCRLPTCRRSTICWPPRTKTELNHGERPAALAEIEAGYAGSLVIRAAFTSLRFREPIPSLTDEYLDQPESCLQLVDI